MILTMPAGGRHKRASGLPVLLAACLAALLSGCSASTSPTTQRDNQLDPGAGTFALKDVSIPGADGQMVLLRLEGSDLVSDPETGTVSLAVTVRNLSPQAVNPPLVVWISSLQPADVTPTGADITLPGGQTDPVSAAGDSTAWGFDYTELLAGAALPAGEATPAKTWVFSDASLVAFSFAARIETGAFAGQARLGGRLFVDLDRNGRPDDGEPAYYGGGVQVTGPGGVVSWSSPGPDGHWEAAVFEAGLYEVLFQSFEMGPLPVEVTTPNPRSVVLTTGPDGTLQSWLEGDFGVVRDWVPPPLPAQVGFTDRRPVDLHRAPWTFLGAQVYGPVLELQVGYSGCGPQHEFSLWMSGGFQESMPPRAQLTLVHETMEECAAYFTQTVRFDLRPLYDRYVESYGSGPLVLVLRGPDDFDHEIELATVPPDSTWTGGGGLPD